MGRTSSKKKDKPTDKDAELIHALVYTEMHLTPGELKRAASKTFAMSFLVMFFLVSITMASLPHITDDSGAHIQDLNGDGIPDILQNIKPEYIYTEDKYTGENKIIGQAGYYNDGPMVSPLKAVLLVLAPLVLIPFYIYIWIIRYPIVLENRKKMAEAGAMPEAISYLIMALSITPSLERALDYASSNASAPLNKRFGKILWDFFLGYERSFRASYGKMAATLGEISEDFKMALLGIYSSVSEHTENGRMTTLNNSFDMVMAGTRDIYERYSSSLGGPTMIVFSLGVILPVVLVSMLPLMDMGTSPFLFTFLVMNVIFPAGTFFYVRRIIQRRPGLPDKEEINRDRTTVSIAVPAVIAMPLLSIGILGYLGYLADYLSDAPGALYSLLVVWDLAIVISLFFYMRSRGMLERHLLNRKMEEQFPDALHHIGAAMADGTPFDKAVSDTAITMSDTAIGEFLKNYEFQSAISIFGNHRNSAVHKSGIPRVISSGLDMARRADNLDSVRAGRVVMKISQYIGSIQRLEKETKLRLSQTTSIIKTTAAVFAPLVLGMSASLYGLTTGQMQYFMSTGFTSEASSTASPSSLSAPAYVFIISLYLIQMGIIMVYFVNGIINENRDVERDLLISKTLPTSMGIFTMSYILSSLLI